MGVQRSTSVTRSTTGRDQRKTLPGRLVHSKNTRNCIGRNTRFHTILSQNDDASNPHHQAVHLFAKIYDHWDFSAHHHGEIAPPKDVGHEVGLGRVIADGYLLRMGAILGRTTSAQQCGLQAEHDHQGCHRDSAPWILRCK